MENINLTIAQNLIKFRVQAGYTQLELAKKINYSDKSISKWERGEGLPDISVLLSLCEIYNVTLNDFVNESKKQEITVTKGQNKSRLLVAFLSAGLVVLVASICFAVLYIIPQTKFYAWWSYLFSIPVCGIVLLVFSEIWGNRLLNTLFATVIIWGSFLSVCLTVNITDIWIICIIGAVLEILVVFWYILRFVHVQNKMALKFFNIFNKNKNNEENVIKLRKNKNKLKKQKLNYTDLSIIEEKTDINS